MKTRYTQNLMTAPLALAPVAELLRRRVMSCPFGIEWPVSLHVDVVTYTAQDNAILTKSDYGYRKRRELVS